MLVVCEAVSHGAVGKGEHLHSQDSGVHCTVYRYCGYGDAGRHLNNGKQSIEPVEHSFDGYADDGEGGVGGNDTGQGGSHTGSGNDHLDATLLCRGGKLLHFGRCTVSREGVDFKGDFHFVEELCSFVHNGEVAGATHDNAYDRSHVRGGF